MEGFGGREHRQDSEAVDESFWDGQGVEIEAREFGDGIWGRGGSRGVENIVRTRMVLTGASGTARASRLRRDRFGMGFRFVEGLGG